MQGFLFLPAPTVLYFPIALMILFMQVRPKPRHRAGLSFKPRAWKLGVKLHWVRIYIAVFYYYLILLTTKQLLYL